ncbi:unnamed protein product [Soboliphyme baturini]|uniref:Uncharacterized protein n=1 Tax=Soboliphyme baturini TaxID=241478 RepID=A0A183J2M0_9BILA|nr:unnamed protein product [Soboliphyme baturini]
MLKYHGAVAFLDITESGDKSLIGSSSNGPPVYLASVLYARGSPDGHRIALTGSHRRPCGGGGGSELRIDGEERGNLRSSNPQSQGSEGGSSDSVVRDSKTSVDDDDECQTTSELNALSALFLRKRRVFDDV